MEIYAPCCCNNMKLLLTNPCSKWVVLLFLGLLSRKIIVQSFFVAQSVLRPNTKAFCAQVYGIMNYMKFCDEKFVVINKQEEVLSNQHGEIKSRTKIREEQVRKLCKFCVANMFQNRMTCIIARNFVRDLLRNPEANLWILLCFFICSQHQCYTAVFV